VLRAPGFDVATGKELKALFRNDGKSAGPSFSSNWERIESGKIDIRWMMRYGLTDFMVATGKKLKGIICLAWIKSL